jgi:hypothetical protein
MKRLIVVAFALVAMALPRTAAAQMDHAEKSRKADLHLTREVIIGDRTLKPGDYVFQCVMIDGKNYLVVKTETGDAIAQVPCEPEALTAKIQSSEFRSVTRDGKQYLTAVRIKGETIAHRVAAPGV